MAREIDQFELGAGDGQRGEIVMRPDDATGQQSDAQPVTDEVGTGRDIGDLDGDMTVEPRGGERAIGHGAVAVAGREVDECLTGQFGHRRFGAAREAVVGWNDAESSLTTHTLDGETISLGGPEALSFRDQARILGELLNREIELRAPAPEQAAAHLSTHVPAPFVAAVLDYWAQMSDRRIEASRSAERITGRPGRTFRQWATENLAAFR